PWTPSSPGPSQSTPSPRPSARSSRATRSDTIGPLKEGSMVVAISTRRLGHSTLDVSAIGLGCMGLSGVYGPADDAQSLTLIQRAIDLGVNHLDSSDMYGWGHNEEVIGRALKGRRDRVVLTTKFGQVQNPG